MKDKHIIRKVDGLGRIVIPKELREIFNINENDYIEFNYNVDSLFIKKYSKLSNKADLLQDVTNIINEYLNAEVFIVEKDKIVSYSGIYKNKYINKTPSKSLIKSINRRECLFEKYYKNLEILNGEKIECRYINESIVINNEVYGLICMYKQDKIVTEYDLKIIKIAKRFIEKYID